MNTQHIHSTNQNTKSRLHGVRNMDSATLFRNKKMLENSFRADDIQSSAGKETGQVSQYKKNSVLFQVISTILVVCFALAVYIYTGVYGGIDSATGKIALGALISFLYVAVFRHAIYAR